MKRCGIIKYRSSPFVLSGLSRVRVGQWRTVFLPAPITFGAVQNSNAFIQTSRTLLHSGPVFSVKKVMFLSRNQSIRAVYSSVFAGCRTDGSSPESPPMLADTSVSTWSKRLGCHANLYTVSPRDESDYHTKEKAHKGSTLALKAIADVTRSPK